VDVEYGLRPRRRSWLRKVQLRCPVVVSVPCGVCDGVPDRTELEGDQIVEFVAAVGVAVSPIHRRAAI
jgi:hypothetical protein